MEWPDIFPADRQPTYSDIAGHVGAVKPYWQSLLDYFDAVYRAKPKLTYSGCSGMPGWNIKFAKSGQSFGTWYPRRDEMYVMLVVAYRFDANMEAILPVLSEYTVGQYREAGDYMKMGKWMMLKADREAVFEDYKKIAAVKLPPKYM